MCIRDSHTLLVQLLDCRHAPSADDEQMLRYLHYHQIPYVVALTKADKLKKSQLAKTLEDFENFCRPYGCQKVVLTSGENGYGIPELQAVLNAAVEMCIRDREMAKCAATPCDVKTTCPDNDPEQTDVPRCV